MKRKFITMIIFILIVSSINSISIIANDINYLELNNDPEFQQIKYPVMIKDEIWNYDTTNSENIQIEYSIDKPTLKNIEIEGINYNKIILSDSFSCENSGMPNIPAKGANILLPPNQIVDKIEVVPRGQKIIQTNYYIIPIEESIPLIQKDIPIPTPDETIYKTNAYYPGKLFTNIGIHSFRGYQILILLLHPVQYNPVDGELLYYTDLEITITTIEKPHSKMLYRNLNNDFNEILNKIDNPDMLINYPKITNNNFDNYDLLILTTDTLSPNFIPLKQAHDNSGTQTIIKTLTDVGSNEIEDIRDYIIYAYITWNIEYVLIGGDDDVVSAPILWVEGLDEGTTPYQTYMPSDIYYACLDGTYNYDGDDKIGETTDGDNGGDVDLIAEVYVGRAPVGNTGEVDNFVLKTVDYINRNSNDNYLEKVCLAGEYLGNHGIASYGGNYLDQLKDSCSDDGYSTIGIPSDIYNIFELYDRDWAGNNWPTSEIVSRINSGQNIINHLGHANYNYNLKMYSSNVNSLTNTDYCFIYSQGCMAGGFDNGDCIAEYFTVKTDNGAFAVIMNARYGWFWSHSTDGDSQRFHREFWDAVYGENMAEIGKANHDSKEDNLPIIGRSCIRWVYYEANLLGDPAVSIHGANSFNADFSWTPEYPRNNEFVYFYDESVGASSYHWDFGDGETSNQQNPSHIYTDEGLFDITLTIFGGGESDSITKTIEIWENWPPIAIATPEYYVGNNPTICFDGSSSWDPDGSIVSYHWDFDDGGTSDEVAPCHTFTDDGIYDVVLTVTDDGGRSSDTHCEIRIDAYTPPETEAIVQGSYGKNGWIKSNVKIVLDATDWTGVDYTKYKIDGGSWTTYHKPFQIWTNGYHEVSFYSVDVYGNTEDVKSVDIKIDTGKPTLNVDIAGDMVDDWYISPVTVTCSASDSGSGLNAIFYRLDGVLDDWSIYEGPFTISNEGEYVLRIYAEDMAGNTFGNNNPFSLKIDTMPPVTTYMLDGEGADGMYYMNVTVGLSAVDTGIGLDATYYRLDGGEWTMYSDSFMVTSVGSHTLEFYSVDMLGKEETVQSVDFSINVINFDVGITNPENGLYLFGNKFINIQRTIIIGAITVEATLMPYDPESEPDYDYVEFFIDDVSKATVTTAPFEWTWDEQAFGEHTIKVVAYNDDESVSDSMVVIIFHL
jgi:PKD repeat protein